MKVVIFSAALLILPWVIAVGLGLLPMGHRLGLALLLAGMTFVVDINLAADLNYRGMSRSIDIGTIDMIALGLLIYLLWQRRNRGVVTTAPRLPPPVSPIVRAPALSFAFLFFLLMNLLSLIGAPDLRMGLFDIVKLLRGMLVFWVAVGLVRDDDMAAALPAFLGIFVGIEALVAARQFLGGAWWVAATFGHKNEFAFVMNLFLPFLFARVLLRPRYRLVFLSLFLAGVLCVVVSRSRTAWFTMGVAMALTVLLAGLATIRRGRLRDLQKIGVILLILVALAVPIGLKLADGIISRWTESLDATLDFRATNNEIALELASTHPLGVGTNNYVRMLKTPVARKLPEIDHTVAHNAYLLVAAETGWIGLFSFLLLWLSYAALAFRLYRHSRSLQGVYVGVGALAGIAAALIHGTTEAGPMLRAHTFFIICALMGFVVAVAQREGFGRVSPLQWLARGGLLRRRVRGPRR